MLINSLHSLEWVPRWSIQMEPKRCKTSLSLPLHRRWQHACSAWLMALSSGRSSLALLSPSSDTCNQTRAKWAPHRRERIWKGSFTYTCSPSLPCHYKNKSYCSIAAVISSARQYQQRPMPDFWGQIMILIFGEFQHPWFTEVNFYRRRVNL